MFTSGDPLHSPYALQDGVASLMLGFTRDDELVMNMLRSEIYGHGEIQQMFVYLGYTLP